MVAIPETPAIRRQVSPFSVATYERMGEEVFGRRTELIRGAILEKMSVSPLQRFSSPDSGGSFWPCLVPICTAVRNSL